MPSKATLSFFVGFGLILAVHCPRSKATPAQAENQGAGFAGSVKTRNLDAAFREALQASVQALQNDQFEAAQTSARQAVALAKSMQPQDERLPAAIGQLGTVYASHLDYKHAEEAFRQQLDTAERLYGAQHPLVIPALENLAMTALAQTNFAASETYFDRAVDLNQKTYGENSTAVAGDLRALAHIYAAQKDFVKGETTLLRVVKIYKTLYGPNDSRVAEPLSGLCTLYDNWGIAEKAAACHARLVPLTEQQFGPSSRHLVRELIAEAQALRRLGRNDEAAVVEQRVESIESALSNLN